MKNTNMEKKNNATIQQRLQNMKKIYVQIGKMIDSLPDTIPADKKAMLKNVILGDKDLKELMDGIDSHRPPRIFLIGRTGVGKSSLINAMCGSYVASVSDTQSCTKTAKAYHIKDGSRTLMEILDTRGIAESESLNSNISAEDMLIQQVNEFSPDVAVLVLSCTHRDGVREDAVFLKKLAESYAKVNGMRLPIVVVVNRCDDMAPPDAKVPSEYPSIKIRKIEEQVKWFRQIVVTNGPKIDGIIGVSSLINWMTADGEYFAVEDIDKLPRRDIENLKMGLDGRYKIEELLDFLEDAIPDVEAKMGLRMAARLNEVVTRLAKHLNKLFSSIAATVALTPIPFSDIYVLITIQSLLVCLIAALSGREPSLDAAKDFVLSMSGVFGAGFTFRMIAQQASKLLNLVFPGVGSTVSASVAGLGTLAIGETAIAYYIEGKSMHQAKKLFAALKKSWENKK